MKKIFFLNLGCPKNQEDGRVSLSKFTKKIFNVSSNISKSDVVLINTCSFIDDAKKESIDAIIECVNFKKEGQVFILMGCLSEQNYKELKKEIPEIDIFLGVNTYKNSYKAYKEFLNDKKTKLLFSKTPYIEKKYKHKVFVEKENFSFVKISEGCSNFCSYCAIPSIRGKKVIYRNEQNVLNEIKFLLSIGRKEIILIAQDLVSDKEFLKNILKKISKFKIKKNFWVRLMYCNPWGVDEELISIIKNEEFIVNYIDMPIQHISDKILKKMNRKIKSSEIIKKLEILKKNDITIRSTLMTGFPGETDKDFKLLEKLVKDEYFHWLGIFPYSPQFGTKAYSMSGRVSYKKSIERRNNLDRLQSDITNSINERYIGKVLKVLHYQKNEFRTFFQAPLVDGVTLVNALKKKNDFTKVKIKEVNNVDLVAVKK
jgi:ribosomal protein S12 methylthiotransferase